MQILRKIRKKTSAKAEEFKQALLPTSLRWHAYLGRYKEVVWLIGDGRSGTTWVSDLINHDRYYRELFEPFHPECIEQAGFIRPHEYVRPGETHPQLNDLCEQVFTGKFVHERTDWDSTLKLYRGLLVKDIFANLMSYWVLEQFEQIRPVLLIRNPFAVACSKEKKKDWFWETDPLNLLNQDKLREDFLQPYEDLIRRVSSKDDFILNQVLIWSIINYVPLRQFDTRQIHLCFYEKVYHEPADTIASLLAFARGVEQVEMTIPDEVVTRPSMVSGNNSNLLAGTSPITSWKNELSVHQIDEGMRILERFGLHDVYDDESMPNVEAVQAAANAA